MKKYFYTNGIDKIGPFSLEELKEQNLSRDTKVWFYGLDNWKPLYEIEELNSLTNSIPPPLKTFETKDIDYSHKNENAFPEKTIIKKKTKTEKP